MLSLHLIGRPWAVTTEVADRAMELLAAQLLDQPLTFGARRAVVGLHAYQDDEDRAAQREQQRAMWAAAAGAPSNGTVAHIPIVGLTTYRGDVVDSEQTVSTALVAQAVRGAASDGSVAAMVLEFDTPGGDVKGMTELAAVIREARTAKPVVAVANGLAASAGFWAASQADELLVTPSGEVGSVGVYGVHEDKSAMLAAQGRKVTRVYAGKYKVERASEAPLTDEARASFQAAVDRYYGLFVADVAKGRKVSPEAVRSGFGEGRLVGAKDAVDLGMADRVGTVQDAFRRAATLASERKRAAAAPSVAQAQADQFKRERGSR